MDGRERRIHKRVEWKGSVRLVTAGGEPIEATIADMSETGCGFNTGRALEPGAPVEIDGTGFFGSGVIRFCYPHQGGFRVGVELSPV